MVSGVLLTYCHHRCRMADEPASFGRRYLSHASARPLEYWLMFGTKARRLVADGREGWLLAGTGALAPTCERWILHSPMRALYGIRSRP